MYYVNVMGMNLGINFFSANCFSYLEDEYITASIGFSKKKIVIYYRVVCKLLMNTIGLLYIYTIFLHNMKCITYFTSEFLYGGWSFPLPLLG